MEIDGAPLIHKKDGPNRKLLASVYLLQKNFQKTNFTRTEEALDKNNLLREQVVRLSTGTEQGSESAFQQASPSPSTARVDSSMLSTMNNWTLGTLNIPECVPSSGENEIDKQAFAYWKGIHHRSSRCARADALNFCAVIFFFGSEDLKFREWWLVPLDFSLF